MVISSKLSSSDFAQFLRGENMMRCLFDWRRLAAIVVGLMVVSWAGAQPLRAEPEGTTTETDAARSERLQELERLKLELERVQRELQLDIPQEERAAAALKLTPAIKLDGAHSWGGGFAAKLSIGWQFEVKTPLRVSQLGIWDTDGNGLDVDTPVAIFNLKGEQLARVVLPKGDGATLVDGFRFLRIDPIELRAGERYAIIALYTPATKDGVISHNAVRFSTGAPLRWLRLVHGRTEELALPETKPAASPADEPLGSFGPNFLFSSEEKEPAVRMYYRTRLVEQAPKQQTVMLPEAADGSHREDKQHTVSVYAMPNGKLTQVMFNEMPLGEGEAALKALAEQLERNGLSSRINRPLLHVVASPTVKTNDLHAVLRVMQHGRYDPRDRGSIVTGSVGTFAASGFRQPHHDGKFVAPDRFEDYGDYVEDLWTGLLWQKDGAASGKKNFYEAADYAAGLELGGLKGWRVPKIEELAAVFPADFAPFTNSHYNPDKCCGGGAEFASYWTSELDPPTEDYAFVYHWYAGGGANNCIASRNFVYVRAVHDSLQMMKP
jgi:hypothetical protein